MEMEEEGGKRRKKEEATLAGNQNRGWRRWDIALEERVFPFPGSCQNENSVLGSIPAAAACREEEEERRRRRRKGPHGAHYPFDEKPRTMFQLTDRVTRPPAGTPNSPVRGGGGVRGRTVGDS
ncbi:hypothetical protein H6P81_001688 [Aristolochia fimbriata]|uniref:Uncharacterized protein n=1 Tax=Aristolochia fimbriata TaxID=158543 RepID=A0AAV7FAC0_ARIFI|nr:hypothetical protein H6P81_001688 [Aristolochia fimbriata]